MDPSAAPDDVNRTVDNILKETGNILAVEMCVDHGGDSKMSIHWMLKGNHMMPSMGRLPYFAMASGVAYRGASSSVV